MPKSSRAKGLINSIKDEELLDYINKNFAGSEKAEKALFNARKRYLSALADDSPRKPKDKLVEFYLRRNAIRKDITPSAFFINRVCSWYIFYDEEDLKIPTSMDDFYKVTGSYAGANKMYDNFQIPSDELIQSTTAEIARIVDFKMWSDAIFCKIYNEGFDDSWLEYLQWRHRNYLTSGDFNDFFGAYEMDLRRALRQNEEIRKVAYAYLHSNESLEILIEETEGYLRRLKDRLLKNQTTPPQFDFSKVNFCEKSVLDRISIALPDTNRRTIEALEDIRIYTIDDFCSEFIYGGTKKIPGVSRKMIATLKAQIMEKYF